MVALDFREIPAANAGSDRDQFELFAREFLVQEGFRILEGPDRGADDGRDLIAEEVRTGAGGQTVVRWLVSCKHKAHSGNSVLSGDEGSIRDRLETHRCTGFIAFYSTITSSGLAATLGGLRPRFDLLIFDPALIERKLLEAPGGRSLAVRYMPRSFNAWVHSSQFAEVPPAPDPQLIRNKFFLREPHTTLDAAMSEAAARSVPVFAVIFDPEHPTLSKLDYSLGYFMEYQSTKRLVDQHFVPFIGSSSDSNIKALVPSNEPLENCLLAVIDVDGTIIRREGVYANPDEGMKRVKEMIDWKR